MTLQPADGAESVIRLATAASMPPETLATTYPYQPGSFWLGRVPGADTPIGFSDDRHVCVVAGNRGGKGTTLIINNLCLWPGSVVVVDPKGENATVTAARRGPGSAHCVGMKQKVVVLDPFNAATVADELRGSYNPLDEIDPLHDEAIDEVGRIAGALVVPTENVSDPFWEESARPRLVGTSSASESSSQGA